MNICRERMLQLAANEAPAAELEPAISENVRRAAERITRCLTEFIDLTAVSPAFGHSSRWHVHDFQPLNCKRQV